MNIVSQLFNQLYSIAYYRSSTQRHLKISNIEQIRKKEGLHTQKEQANAQNPRKNTRRKSKTLIQDINEQ